jgi:hypothetical protein
MTMLNPSCIEEDFGALDLKGMKPIVLQGYSDDHPSIGESTFIVFVPVKVHKQYLEMIYNSCLEEVKKVAGEVWTYADVLSLLCNEHGYTWCSVDGMGI